MYKCRYFGGRDSRGSPETEMGDEKKAAVWGSDLEDFSLSATLVPFDPPVPLLRGPLPAGLSDDPSLGPFVLAFRDAGCWRSAFWDTESKILEQCEAGARVGCSISASKKCSPSWWKSLFGVAKVDYAERELCEEREMLSCVTASKESCIQFAKEKCLLPFRDARVALVDPERSLDSSISHISQSKARSMKKKPVSSCQQDFPYLSTYNLEVTNYRGNVLLENSLTEHSSKV